MTLLMKSRMLMAVTGLGLMLTACNTAPLPVPQKVGNSDTQLALNSVNVIDKNLMERRRLDSGVEYDFGKIRIESSGTARTATGTLEAWTMVQNLTDYPLYLQGHVRFLDAQRRPLENYSAWQRISLPPKGTALYKESSLSDAATYYFIELREGQ